MRAQSACFLVVIVLGDVNPLASADLVAVLRRRGGVGT